MGEQQYYLDYQKAIITVYRHQKFSVNFQGFSLVELMIVIAIIGIAAAVAFPNFARWTLDSRTRTVAETLQNSIRLAQAEAVKNGARVSFFLTNAAPVASAATNGSGLNWGIVTVATPTIIQSGVLADQGGTLAITTIPNTPAITFNSIGRLVGQITPVTYRVTNAGGRRLAVQVSTAGRVRMCDLDKVLNAANPDGCV